MKIQQILFSAALAVSLSSHAATYYVDSVNGDDSRTNLQATSIATPWKSIAKANNTLVAGDAVYLRAGTYTDQIRPVNNGTSDTARISYVAFGDGNVFLDTFGNTGTGNLPTVGAIALGGKSYITVMVLINILG